MITKIFIPLITPYYFIRITITYITILVKCEIIPDWTLAYIFLYNYRSRLRFRYRNIILVTLTFSIF